MKLIHAGLLVSDLTAAAGFYEDVLGLKRAERPALGFEGIFYALDGTQQIHLMQLANPYEGCALPDHGGRDRHLALGVTEIAPIRQRLDAAGITYTLSKSGRAALFTRDPDGNAIELCELST